MRCDWFQGYTWSIGIIEARIYKWEEIEVQLKLRRNLENFYCEVRYGYRLESKRIKSIQILGIYRPKCLLNSFCEIVFYFNLFSKRCDFC